MRRALARRLVRLTVVLAVLGSLAGGLIAFTTTESLSDTAYRNRVADGSVRQNVSVTEVRKCLLDHGVEPGDRVPEEVGQACYPQVRSVRDPRFHRSRLKGILQGVSGVFAIAAWVVGASLVGAEFASRSMTTLLTWEPRRHRVLAAKATAALLVSATLCLFVLALVVASMLPAMILHGAPVSGTDPTVATLAGVVGRGVVLAAVAGGMGFAIATVGRNTAAALGAGFAYIVILENILGSSVERWRRWLLLGNVIVFVSGENSAGEVPGRTVTEAGLFLVAVMLTMLVAAGTAFRARDIG